MQSASIDENVFCGFVKGDNDNFDHVRSKYFINDVNHLVRNKLAQ